MCPESCLLIGFLDHITQTVLIQFSLMSVRMSWDMNEASRQCSRALELHTCYVWNDKQTRELITGWLKKKISPKSGVAIATPAAAAPSPLMLFM